MPEAPRRPEGGPVRRGGKYLALKGIPVPNMNGLLIRLSMDIKYDMYRRRVHTGVTESFVLAVSYSKRYGSGDSTREKSGSACQGR